jgi:hypothetical protein
MKKLLLLLIVGTLVMPLNAQKLIDIYKRGTVKLIPDMNYAQGNNWSEIFKGFNDKSYGFQESLIIASDGSLIVNHSHLKYYSRFSSNGKFLKRINIVDDKGSMIGNSRPIAGSINNTFFTTANASGVIRFFDFNGNMLNKSKLSLNYMVDEIIALPNGKLAIVGFTQWTGKNRYFVAIIDHKTKQEKIVCDYFLETTREPKSEPFNYIYQFKKGGIISFTTMPFTNIRGMLVSKPQIASFGGNLIVAMPVNGEIFIYDLNGKLQSQTKVTWPNQQLSVEEQKEIQKKAIEKYKNINFKIASWVSSEDNEKAKQKIVKEMEADLANISKPISKPYFAHMIKDSDENLLFFEYPKEKNANKFNVWIYKNGGEFICQSSFECDDYELEINPSKMVFLQWVYLRPAKIKKCKGEPFTPCQV